MSGCCKEHGCKRKEPYAVFMGLLSGRVFLASRSQDLGKGLRRVVGNKHDITEPVEQFIRQNRNWVRDVLEDEKES